MLRTGKVVRVGNPDSAALFAVRPDGLALDGSRDYAFAHLDRRPRPEMAALPIGERARGSPRRPAYFAVSTYAVGLGHRAARVGACGCSTISGQALPGWPAALPSIVTTPPVIAGTVPGC